MRIPRSIHPLIILTACVLALFAAPLRAEDRILDFLHALQEQNFADVALEYLDQLEHRSNLPADVRDVLDLERCNSYLAWARMASDTKQAERRAIEAQSYLNKFRQGHPQDPRAAGALVFWGNRALDKARQALARVERETDATAKSQARRDARGALAEASDRLNQAVDFMDAARGPAAGKKLTPQQRQELEIARGEARFALGMVHFYSAQLVDPADKAARKETLTKAAQQFEGAYQGTRNFPTHLCMYANLWHARALQEMGDFDAASDIYEEVMAGAPEKPQAGNELAPLYCMGIRFQLAMLSGKGEYQDVVEHAAPWLAAHAVWNDVPEYQGLVLDLAKAKRKLAEKGDDAQRARLQGDAVALLRGVTKVPGTYREEAVLLLRQWTQGHDGSGAAGGLDEALAMGDAAMGRREWAEAEKSYAQALQLAEAAHAAEQAAEARQRWNRARFASAAALFVADKLEESMKLAGEIAKEDLADPSAGRAALLALSSAVNLARKADAHSTAQSRAERVAEYVIKRWAGKPEADDARILMGRARLQAGDAAGAALWFRQVRPDSPRYASAQYVMAQSEWKTYFDEKQKEESARNAARMSELRAQAQKHLQTALDQMQGGLRVESAESGNLLADAQLLMTSILMEGKQFREAAALLDPRVADIKARHPQAIDKATFDIFVSAVRAHLELGEVDRAADAALVLVEIAGDDPKFNEVLVALARHLVREYKRLEATTGGFNATAQSQQAAAQREALQKVILQFVQRLLKRGAYSLPDTIRLADVCDAVGLNDQAFDLYQMVVNRAKDDPESAKGAEKILLRAQAQLVGLLRTQKKFDEALRQCDDLIKANPRALDPRLVRARILEDWAKTDPAKYGPAVSQWAEVRLLLGRTEPKPALYYEALYNTARCLFSQWQATRDPVKLNQAEQVLHTSLIMEPKLNGPDSVAQFNDLLKQITALRPAAGPKPSSPPSK